MSKQKSIGPSLDMLHYYLAAKLASYYKYF